MTLLKTLLGLLVLLVCLPSSGSVAPELVRQQIFYWRDASGQADIEQVRRMETPAQFKVWDAGPDALNLGYTPDVHWVRWRITLPQDAPGLWVMELPYHGLESVDLYLPTGELIRVGKDQPASVDQLEHRFPSFRLDLQPGVNDVYLRVISQSALTVPLRLWSPREFLGHVQVTTALQAFYFGALLVMVVYNFFLSLSLRDRRFLGYVLFGTALCLGMLSGNGYGRLYLWPQWLVFDQVAQTFFLTLAAAFSVDFSRTFLELEKRSPPRNRVLLSAQALLVAFALVSLVSSIWPFGLQWILQVLALLVVCVAAMIFVQGMRALLDGIKGVRFFLLAWSVLWIGVIVATLRTFGWVPSNSLTMYAIQIASAFEMLLLAFALADIVHQERAERDLAQFQALQLKEDLVRQLRSSEDRLEQAVVQRTQELEQALGRQKHLLDQYVRFGALISHEFRNPLGIIQSQVSVIRKSFGGDHGSAGLNSRLDIIVSAAKRLTQLFDRWLQGGRLQSLGDQITLQPVNLNGWLADLMVSLPQFTQHHALELVDAPAAAPAMADLSLLEIAMLNLVDNACKYSPPGSRVRVGVLDDGQRVGLVVEDEGQGIAADQQQIIFEEYIRLKTDTRVHGLGLGLALVKRVAQLLGGSIELSSEPGRGSRFCLWLPRA